MLQELVDFGIARYQENYSRRYQDTDLVLYKKYTYEDACRLLGWEHNEVPLNIGGYKYDMENRRHFRYLLIMIREKISVIRRNTRIILSAVVI